MRRTVLWPEEPSAVPNVMGSEAECRNQEAPIAERREFHGVILSCGSEVFAWREGVSHWHGRLSSLEPQPASAGAVGADRRSCRCKIGAGLSGVLVVVRGQAQSSVERGR